MIDEVADNSIEGLILEVKMVGIALLEPTAVDHLLCLGIVLAHPLAIVPLDAPIVNACTVRLREMLGTADGQRTCSTPHVKQPATAVPWQTRDDELVHLSHHSATIE